MTDNKENYKRSKNEEAVLPEIIQVPKRFKIHWQFKIYDNEEMEPPHVTINGPGGDTWRWDLRKKNFISDPPPPYARDVPKEIVKELKNKWVESTFKWNTLHPHNPVIISDEDLKNYLISINVEDFDWELKKYKKMLLENRIFE